MNRKECSFCHNTIGKPHDALLLADIGSDDYDDGFDYIYAEVDITKYNTLVLYLKTDVGDEDIDEIDINFCPICGRELRKKKGKIAMRAKELEEKLNSLYDPNMMRFTVEDSNDTVVVLNYCSLNDHTSIMYRIGPKKKDLECAIAYADGQIAGYKERQQRPEDFASVISAWQAIRDFEEERLREHDN